MPDLETRMPELLRRAARGAPTDERLERRVLRRARRRRVVNASAAGLLVVVLLAGTFAGVRGVLRSDGATIADETPTPSPSPSAVASDRYLEGAIWPEVTVAGLAAAQASVDDGHQPWRLDPVQTAAAFAVNVFDWDPDDVDARRLAGPEAAVSVVVSNRGLGPGVGTAGPPAPETVIRLDQLGRTGEDGVWTVAAADSPYIELDALDGARISFRLVDTIPEWAPGVSLVVEGQHTDDILDALGPDGEGTLSPQETFEVGIPAGVGPAGSVIGVAVFLWDPEGTLVTAEAFPYVVPDAAATGPTGSVPPTDALPGAVLATRDRIAIAAETRDYQALEALVDPDRFAYNFDDGSDPMPLWREDPAVLDTLATILRMPFTTNREAYPDVHEASPTVYIWPSLMASDLSNPTAEERAMLETLGISPREIRDMLEAFGGYVGPRTGIAEDGTWVFYATGGD